MNDLDGDVRPPKPQSRSLLGQALQLQRLELLVVKVPQKESFRSAVGVRYHREALFLRLYDDAGHWGIGECSCRPDPFFNHEFLHGAMMMVQDHLWPLLPRKGSLGAILAAIDRIREWPFTRAAVVEALLDLLRRRGTEDGVDHWPGSRLQDIPIGISLGLFPHAEAALERIGQAVARGYRRVKLKVKAGMDLAFLTELRRQHPTLALLFDANATGTADDLPFFDQLAEFQPTAIEQPFAKGRLDLCLKLKEATPSLRICLDEEILGRGDVFNAGRLGAADEINLKPGRVGGQIAALEVIDEAASQHLPLWIGGMFETGVGRLQNLRMASLLTDATAHDLSPSSRYFDRDVVQSPPTMNTKGLIALPEQSSPQLDDDAFRDFLVTKLLLEKRA